MRSIQDVGAEILGGTPGKFYIFCGYEYGIKRRYLQLLQDHYGSKVEVSRVSEILNLMSTKHIIPLKPTLYVVRYDEEFVSTLSDKTSKSIDKCNIIGTVVCLYESSSSVNKLDKYLPTYTVSIDSVNPKYVLKYLHSEFTNVPDRLLEFAAKYSRNYSNAQSICRAISTGDTSKLFQMSDSELCKLFGLSVESDVESVRIGLASRNFRYLVDVIDNYCDDLNSALYTFLSTLLELEKLIGTKYGDSDLRSYLDLWTREDIYNMFMNTYLELKKLRSVYSDTYSSMIYLCSLLQFKRIPSVESMSWN